MLGDGFHVDEIDIEIGGDAFSEFAQFEETLGFRGDKDGRNVVASENQVIHTTIVLVFRLARFVRLHTFQFHVDVMKVSAIL